MVSNTNSRHRKRKYQIVSHNFLSERDKKFNQDFCTYIIEIRTIIIHVYKTVIIQEYIIHSRSAFNLLSEDKEFQYYANMVFCIHKSVSRETNICYFVQTHPSNNLLKTMILVLSSCHLISPSSS